MAYFLLGLTVLAVVIVTFLRRHRKAARRNTLCWRCRYDSLDICREKQRGHALQCDLFSEEDEDSEEYEEYEEVEEWRRDE